MIEASDADFPNNIVDLLQARFALVDNDLFVTRRPLRPTDPNQSIGIIASNWVPDDDSKEMSGKSPMRPPLTTYLVSVQAYIKDMDEERGLAVHSVLSRIVRDTLYSDEPLRVALGTLTSTLNGVTESARRWGVRQQRFVSNELRSQWVHLSILEFWLETETR